MTLGSAFPVKRGNLGNVIRSAGLQAERRTFASGAAAAMQRGSEQRALSVPLALRVRGDTYTCLPSDQQAACR